MRTEDIIMSIQIKLVGDSIFDNGRYVPKGEAVIDHLRNKAPDARI
jgi:hypothetical protein